MPPSLPQNHLIPSAFGKDRGREVGRSLCALPASPSRDCQGTESIMPISYSQESLEHPVWHGQSSHVRGSDSHQWELLPLSSKHSCLQSGARANPKPKR